jgi:hypothetical protein
MSLQEPFNPQLHELLCELSDADLTPELLREIEALVLADPQAKQQYLAYMQLESAAQHLLANSQFEHVGESITFHEANELEASPVPLLLFPVEDSSIADETCSLNHESSIAGHSGVRWASMFVGSVAVLAGGFLLGIWNSDRDSHSLESGHAAVATLVSTQHCRWDGSDSNLLLNPGARLPVGRLSLAEG